MSENKFDIRVYPLDNTNGNTRAFASVTFDDLIAIRGIKIIEGKKGMFVSMPQAKDNKTGKYHDVAFPLSGNLRKEISSLILGEYKRVVELPPDKQVYANKEKNSISIDDVEEIKIKLQVYPITEPKGTIKAFASVSVNDSIGIRNIRVLDGEKGLFIAMPQTKDKENNYYDVAFPVCTGLRNKLNDLVIQEFIQTDKSIDSKKSLGERLAAGAAKAVLTPPVDKSMAAQKSQAPVMA